MAMMKSGHTPGWEQLDNLQSAWKDELPAKGLSLWPPDTELKGRSVAGQKMPDKALQ